MKEFASGSFLRSLSKKKIPHGVAAPSVHLPGRGILTRTGLGDSESPRIFFLIRLANLVSKSS